MICCINNHLETLEILLQYDADLIIKDLINKNIYDLATEYESTSIDLIDNITKKKLSLAVVNSSINLKKLKFAKPFHNNNSESHNTKIPIFNNFEGCTISKSFEGVSSLALIFRLLTEYLQD